MNQQKLFYKIGFSSLSGLIKRSIGGIAIFFFCLAYTFSTAQKNDTIYLLNGDKITGEIKKFEYGLLYLSTDAMLTVNIPFDRINTIYSKKLYEVVTIIGHRYFCGIEKSTTQGSVRLVLAADTVEKPLWDIVNIAYIKTSFFQRIDGNANVGLSYTKASEVLQYNLYLMATYRITNYAVRLELSSILTQQQEVKSTQNNDFDLSLTRFLQKKWFVKVYEKFQQNTELDLLYRFQSGAGPGYDFVRTNKIRFYGVVGLVQNVEETIETKLFSSNTEAFGTLQARWLKFRHPKVDISAGVTYFPSLTIQGRYRSEFKVTGKYELINDLFFNIDFYNKYDSKNISDGTANSDYGIVTSLSYVF